MSDTVIRVENLSKKYIIRHQQAQQYTALRDVITDGVKSIGRRLTGAKQESSQASTREEFWALKDVSFEVKQGDRVGIIGRNGAGKSTLLKILSRIVQPTTGEITLNGRVASLLEVGTGFHPELTGRENIYLNGAILGMGRTEIQKKFDEIVDFAEVEKFLDTSVKRYSSGMYVKLAFAVAAHLEPEILIIDEVLAVGDLKFQQKCLSKMNSMSKSMSTTLLLVSHNMSAIKSLCNNCIILEKGRSSFKEDMNVAVSEYIEDGNDYNKLSWKKEDGVLKNEYANVTAVKIYNRNNNHEEIEITDEIIVQIEFDKLAEKRDLYVSIHVNNSLNECVLASVNFPEATIILDKWSIIKMPKGKYISKVMIPKNFLNDKSYNITVLVLDRENMNVIQALPNVIFFRGVDVGEMRGRFFGEWIGSIRPKLHWITEKNN